jgi:hypothetical protein
MMMMMIIIMLMITIINYSVNNIIYGSKPKVTTAKSKKTAYNQIHAYKCKNL